MTDRRAIATGVLSYAAPLAAPDDQAGERAGARAVNEYAAELVRNRPDRFGLFAALPLPDVDAALVRPRTPWTSWAPTACWGCPTTGPLPG
ncbi:hypothetical protein E1265_11440 [Streptomyces sp. 8K308]|uniref:hypothetical protein n=1 Tax=Streptomyces sp. 8K308 TaxID=2530388 RepID=UPI00105195B5|nr:hypothetical protein [Streptomyces sp. 8K308]TDC23930.1 hypothetical protein E1265_11440 [Streptomyces sp. 8K308]